MEWERVEFGLLGKGFTTGLDHSGTLGTPLKESAWPATDTRTTRRTCSTQRQQQRQHNKTCSLNPTQPYHNIQQRQQPQHHILYSAAAAATPNLHVYSARSSSDSPTNPQPDSSPPTTRNNNSSNNPTLTLLTQQAATTHPQSTHTSSLYNPTSLYSPMHHYILNPQPYSTTTTPQHQQPTLKPYSAPRSTDNPTLTLTQPAAATQPTLNAHSAQPAAHKQHSTYSASSSY
ncbi:unnamed protein product [Arctogadus glacialis]